MNFLTPYYTQLDKNQIAVSAAQGSHFAKQVAGDFNPIHNADSKRFCVPGDLLFALTLDKYGLHKTIKLKFLDLVSANTPLYYPEKDVAQTNISFKAINGQGKPVLDIKLSGCNTDKGHHIEKLVTNYVAFSGQNFPYILIPLMKKHDVMINTKRPLVIYESMELELNELEFETLDINLEKTTLDVVGKRGNAELHFLINANGKVIGTGLKKLVLSGLRQYEESAIVQLCDEYLNSKNRITAD